MSTLSESSEPSPARPTMRDVARLSGVSIKTVSRVINDEPGVSAPLIAQVRVAASQLGYRPDMTASSLRRAGHRTATIGLILEDLANPFSAALNRAIEDIARPSGVAVFAGSVDEDPEQERALASAFLARRVDGLVIVPAADTHSYLMNDIRAGVPIVFVDRPPRHLDADAVLADNQAGADLAVSHLIGVGHKRIVFLGDLRTISTARERFAGFQVAMERAGLTVTDDLVRTDLHTPDEADAVVTELFGPSSEGAAPGPTAVFASRNVLTIGAFRALKALGRHREIALIGLDDFPLADMLDPGVTVVAQDPITMGHLAGTQLFRRMGGDRSPTSLQIVPMALIPRGSGEISPQTQNPFDRSPSQETQ